MPCGCRSTTPDQWEDFSNRNIQETDKQCQNSAALRVIVDGVLQTACNDMRRQKDETDVALARRIDETRDAKEKLEAHLAKVRPTVHKTVEPGTVPHHIRDILAATLWWFTAAPKPLKYKFLGDHPAPGVAQPLYSRGHN